jgi:hypothetical protein
MLFLQNAAMMNQAMDDMDEISGISLGGGRIPVAALAGAMKSGSVYNNIRISNSTVGVFSTGDLARIDAVITLTKDTDVEAIGETLKNLTQTIIDTRDIDHNAKRELVELIQSLAEQVVGSQGARKPSVIMTLVRGIEERAKKLEETMSGKRGDDLMHAALNWNFPFAPSDYRHSETTYVSSASNPVLVRRIYDPLRIGPNGFAHADALWEWVKTNIQLPKSLITEIENERNSIKSEAR